MKALADLQSGELQRAVEAGIGVVDASVGGIGGCPFAPGAPGNLATESLCRRLDQLGIAHGVDPVAVEAAAASMRTYLTTPA